MHGFFVRTCTFGFPDSYFLLVMPGATSTRHSLESSWANVDSDDLFRIPNLTRQVVFTHSTSMDDLWEWECAPAVWVASSAPHHWQQPFKSWLCVDV